MDQQNQQIIDEIELVLENNSGYGYKVSHCRSHNRDWKIMSDISGNIRNFKKNINRILQTGSEALKIELFKNVGVPGKRTIKVEEYIVKVVDYPVPLADQANLDQDKEISFTPKVILPHLSDTREASQAINTALAGIQTEMLNDKHQSAMMIIEIKHQNELDKLQREIQDLKKDKDREIESLVKENNELSDAYDDALDRLQELEEKSSTSGSQYSKLAGAGVAMLLGKHIGLGKTESFQLAGILMGADLPAENEITDQQQAQEDPSQESPGRKSDLRKLYDWLQTLNDEQFMKIAQIIIAIDRDPSLLDVLCDLVKKDKTPFEQESEIQTEE